MRSRRHILGIIALLLGACALGLAAIPAVAFDEPHPWLTRKEREEHKAVPAARTDSGGGVTISTKRLNITIGKKRDRAGTQPAEAQPADDAGADSSAPAAPRPRRLRPPRRGLTPSRPSSLRLRESSFQPSPALTNAAGPCLGPRPPCASRR